MNYPVMPKDVKKIISQLNSNGFEAYIVGGCVRDSIMGLTPHDWDITTSAMPLEVKKIFKHTYDTGINHGTVTVLENGIGYEVTTYRIDGEYKDFRRPENVLFTRELSQDLQRRDFTMNAVAFNESEGYIDIFSGIRDIKNRIIRGVGEPEKRFNEDALRILRAIRFSAQLDFDIEPETEKALKRQAVLIKNISAERIRDELLKLLMSKNVNRVPLLWESEVLKYVDEDLYESMLGHTDELLKALRRCEKSYALVFAVLFKYLDYDKTSMLLNKLKFDTKNSDIIKCIAQRKNDTVYTDKTDVKRLVSAIGEEKFICLMKYRSALGERSAGEAVDRYYEALGKKECIFIRDLQINGGDLIEMGIEKGVRIGKILNELLNLALITPQFNTKDSLKKYVADNYL